jgi:hypothetical protein
VFTTDTGILKTIYQCSMKVMKRVPGSRVPTPKGIAPIRLRLFQTYSS